MVFQGDGALESGLWKESQAQEPEEWTEPSPSTRTRRWTMARLMEPLFPLPKAETAGDKTLKQTAWLDGLRGFAAFLVYWHHNELWVHKNEILENGFGYEGKHYFATLPGIRLFFTGGHFAVAFFFVISGYALSWKSMSLIHSGEYLKLGDTLSSSLFRRWIRLYLPIIGTTFVYLTLQHILHIWTAAYEAQGSWGEDLWLWYVELKNFSFIYRQGGEPWFRYNVHLWSIPLEAKGSIIIYTVLPAISRCTKNARLWCEIGLIFYFLYIADGYYGAMFIAGMLLCDLDQLAARHELPRWLQRFDPFKELIYCQLFVLGLWLGGVPTLDPDASIARKSPGWYYILWLKPQAVYDYKWFFLFWGAVMMVAAVPRLPWLRAFFETRFNQHLGRIAYSLYLMHGPVLWTLGDRLYAATGCGQRADHARHLPGWLNRLPLPQNGPYGLEIGFLAMHLVLLPLTLWMANLVTRFVDEPSVRFAGWLYKRTLGGGAGTGARVAPR